MPHVRPFRAVRYSDTTNLKNLVCPPYDVISSVEQRRLHDRDPNNAVHLELASAGYDRDERNRTAAETFWRWLDEGVLRRDRGASFSIYRQDFVGADGRRRRVAGVIGALDLEPLGERSGVLPHERTMPGPIIERLSLMRALPVNTSPIYAIYRGEGGLTPFLDSLEHRPTASRFADEHGTLHRLWVIQAPAELETLAEALKPGPLVIADGHHRYETALAFSRQQTGPGGHEAVLCFCVDADSEDVTVLPYHRALLTGVAPESLLDRLAASYPATPISAEDGAEALADSAADHPFLWHTNAGDVLIEVSDADVVTVLGNKARAWRDLDVVALHEAVFREVLPEGTRDLRFSKDAAEIRRLVDGEHFDAGVILRPIDPTDVVEVARSGERVPQKASYFWPKALTGLLFRPLVDKPPAPA